MPDVELDKVFKHEFGPVSFPVQHCWDADDFKLLSVKLVFSFVSSIGMVGMECSFFPKDLSECC
jgi:hypothetical protein